MKSETGPSICPSRELLALASLFAVTHAAADPATSASPPEPDPKKKKAAEADALRDIVVEGARTGTYQPEALQSPKFTAPLVDTPKTITVIPQELIKERGATSLTEILRATPGVSLGAGEGGTPAGDRPFIRGYEASTDIMIDGMRDLARFSHEAFNVEQVEIVKGPGSAYSGRGSTGGSINLSSKTPKAANFSEWTLGYGSDNFFRTTGDVNWAISETIAFRLNAMYNEADVPGRNDVEFDRYGFAPSITFGLGTATRATLSYYYLSSDEIPDLGHPFGPSKPVNVDRDNFYGVVDRDFRENDAQMGTFRLEHDLTEEVMIRNTFRMSETDNDYIMTRPTLDAADPTRVDRSFRASRRHGETLMNQTDVIASFKTGTLGHKLAAGFEYSEERIKAGSYANISAPDADLEHPKPHDPVTGELRTTPYGTPTKTDTVAFYAFDTVQLHEQWQVNLGARFDKYDVDNGTISRQDDLFNYQVGLVYKPLPYGSVYASYGTSSNPAGETQGQSGGADGAAGGGINEELKPEKSYSAELGTKWDFFDNNLSLTAALFQTEKTDARSQNPDTGEISLDGNTRSRGIELGVAGNLTEKWHVWAGYTYMDPEIIKYRSGGNDFDGNQMKFVSKQSYSLWSSYDITEKFTAGGGLIYMGKRYMNDANTLSVDSYYRVDGMLSYQVTEDFNLRLNVNNITDETIYDASHVGLFAVVAPGRSAVLTATYKF